MTKEGSNIAMQYIPSLSGDPYVILIGESPELFIVDLVKYKHSCDISQCLIWYFIFPLS